MAARRIALLAGGQLLKGSAMKNPRTPRQWQEAVNAADALIKLESARLYGLVSGGPKVNAERCDEILAKGKAKGILPDKDNVERLVEELTA